MSNHLKLIIALWIIGGSLTWVWLSNRKYSEETTPGMKPIPLGGILYIPKPTETPRPQAETREFAPPFRDFAPPSPEERLERRKKLVETLDLSPEQKKQLEEIGYFNPPETPGNFREMREKLNQILTPEQREKMREEMRKRRGLPMGRNLGRSGQFPPAPRWKPHRLNIPPLSPLYPVHFQKVRGLRVNIF